MYLLLYLQLFKTLLSLLFVTVYFVSEVLRVKVTAFVLVIHSTELKKNCLMELGANTNRFVK